MSRATAPGGFSSGDVGDQLWFENLLLKYVGAWREQKVRFVEDWDGTRFPVFSFSSAGGPDAVDGGPGFQRQVQQELQLNGNAWDGRLTYVGGRVRLLGGGQPEPGPCAASRARSSRPRPERAST